MKHIIIKLSFLFVTMSVLTSSKEDTGNNKSCQAINTGQACIKRGDEYATNISCKQIPVAKENAVDTYKASVDDSEISLSPISRFILLQ